MNSQFYRTLKKPPSGTQYFLLTIDVEDWFQVENFKAWIPSDSWSARELRVEKNTHGILDLLDAIQLNKPAPQSTIQNYPDSPKATFFVLGWIAARLPGLVREIHDRGHEVASHGYGHQLCTHMPVRRLKKDLGDSKKQLEDITGAPVDGYRAPSFSISTGILRVIRECGYGYDSSYNSFSLNPRYGAISLNGFKKYGIAWQIDDDFFELPVSNLDFNFSRKSKFKMKNSKLPWGGGGYFRLMPLVVFRKGIRKILAKQNAYLFYLHPWELDPKQPRVTEAAPLYRFRHYANLSATAKKLARMIKAFARCRFISCSEYLRVIQASGI